MLAVLMLLPAAAGCFPGKAAGTAVASFGQSGVYMWKWVFCDSYQTMKDTGFTSSRFNANMSSVTGLYTMVLTTGNNKCYFANSPGNGNEYWWGSGAVADSDWFDASGEPFLTTERHTTNVVSYDGDQQSGAAAWMRIFFETSPYFTYDRSGNVTRGTIGNISGLGNNGNLDWTYEKGYAGEQFTFYFSNAKNVPKNSDFYGRKDAIRIAETSNTKYVWCSFDDHYSISETKNDNGERSLFNFWLGHFINVPGLGDGQYTVPSGGTLFVDDDVSLISDNATLTIEKDAVMYVKGKLYLNGTIRNYGTIIVEDGGEIIIGYENSVGKIYSEGGKNRDGNMVIQKGGALELTSVNNFSYQNGSFVQRYTYFSFTGGNLTVAGDFRFTKMPQNFRFSRTDTVFVPGSRIIIPAGLTLSDYENYYMDTSGMHSFDDRSAVYADDYLLKRTS